MYNLNPYMCNCVVFNCTVHIHELYTSLYIIEIILITTINKQL